MVRDRIERDLRSTESVIAAAAIAFALPAVYLGGQLEAMESGFALLFATAVYPPLYYRESGRTIAVPSRGLPYGLGAAAAVYLTFLLCHRLAERAAFEGTAAEIVAFVLVSVIVVGLALVERRYVNATATGR